MYNNPYAYNPQASIERINSQIGELEKMRQQLQQATAQQPQATNLTQNFQLAPTNRESIRYADSMETVKRELVTNDTPFFSSDYSVMWLKNSQGEIKTYELREIVAKDEKDLKIEYLQAQINELKEGIKNEQSDANINDTITEPDKKSKPQAVSTVSKTKTKSK